MKRLTSSLLIGLGLALGISNGSFLAQPTEEFQTFTEWCENKNQLPQETQHTIEVLLEDVFLMAAIFKFNLINKSLFLLYDRTNKKLYDFSSQSSFKTPVLTSMPAFLRRSIPLPSTASNGSVEPITTRGICFSTIRSAQGGVLP